MPIQRMQDQHNISFLDSLNIKKIDKNKKQKNIEDTLIRLAEEQKSKKFDPKDSVYKSGKSILSSQAGEVTEKGGPSKFIKSETANSVWDPQKIEKKAKEKILDNTISEDPKVLRKKEEEERLNKLVEALQGIDQKKANSVSPTGIYQGSNFKETKQNMSIFDTEAFQRLPEKTAGEKVTEENKQRKNQIDESWKNNGKAISSSSIVSKLFDNLDHTTVGK